MMRIAAGVEYCGADFSGWQSQSGQRTVQACVEAAISVIADHPVQVQCAGRTDAGVHAVHQVIHFDTTALREPRSWVLGANTKLPHDINLLWAQPAANDFNSRFSALSRRYKYLILNRPVRSALNHKILTCERNQLDVVRMAVAARDLVGEHDFTSYRAVSCQARTPVRQIKKLEVSRQGSVVIIEVEANAFLHHMVRNIAGVLMTIGKGDKPAGWAKEVLHARDRTAGGITALADGLYLMEVCYEERFAIPRQDNGLHVLERYGLIY